MKNLGNRLARFSSFVVVGGRNIFLPLAGCFRMGFRSLLFSSGIGLVLFGATSCKGPQLVSSTVQTHKKDSTTTITKTVKDSVGYVEKEIQKTLPASSIENTYTKAQFDSLLAGLRQMPQGSRTIIHTDPKMQTTLSIILDSLGKVHFKCTTLERTYYERDIEKTHYIQSLTAELTKVNEKNSLLTEQVKQYKKGFWEKVQDSLQSFLLKVLLFIIAVGIVVALIEFGWTKIKNWIKAIL